MRLIALFAALPALTACSLEVNKPDKAQARDAVHIALAKDGGGGANRISMKLPFVDAAFKLPTFGLADHMDLDGIRLAPDTDVRGVDVRSGKGEHGAVRVDFTNPSPPAALLDFYRRAVIDAGYAMLPGSNAESLAAAKGKQRFALSLAPEGNGSKGRIALNGDE